MLQHELGSLARRQGELEEIEIEVMERAEAAELALTSRREELGGLESQLAATTVERDRAHAEVGVSAAETEAPRAGLVEEIGADLVALYEKARVPVRCRRGGVAAATLPRLPVEVNASDLAAIRAAAADELLRCEECGRILVRRPESGL